MNNSTATANKIIQTGKRKRSIARIILTKSSSPTITVNGKTANDYFNRNFHRLLVTRPLGITDNLSKFSVICNVTGGGLTGQAGAIKHAISKALCLMDNDLRPVLRKSGLLTRDSRQVERKKFGRPKARKKFQFSKR